MSIATLMIDVLGTHLDDDDILLLDNPEVAGVILFARNVESPKQVRALCDAMRSINPHLIIAADQEGGRVARFRQGFTLLPAMGRLGAIYDIDPELAISLAHDVAYVMACEVLVVGVDISFAPVLDVAGISTVIQDRAFHRDPSVVSRLGAAFIDGMHQAGMKVTGKHYPGHGSVAADSHTDSVCDGRTLDELTAHDLVPFHQNLDRLDALMPAHVIYECVDDKPAGFSKVWLQDLLRKQMGYDGVLFSDDLCMAAAQKAGGIEERVAAAISAGCDVALVCNDRKSAWQALAVAKTLTPAKDRFGRMKAHIPAWLGDLVTSCQAFDGYATARARVIEHFGADGKSGIDHGLDPTCYTIRHRS